MQTARAEDLGGEVELSAPVGDDGSPERVLRLQTPQPLRFAHPHPAVLTLPAVQRLCRPAAAPPMRRNARLSWRSSYGGFWLARTEYAKLPGGWREIAISSIS